MKLRTRFILGFLLIALITCISGIFSLSTYYSVRDEFALLEQDVVPGALFMLETEAGLTTLFMETTEAFETGEAIHHQQAAESISKLRASTAGHTEHEKHIGEEEGLAAQQLEDKIAQIISVAEQAIAVLETDGARPEAAEALMRQMHQEIESLAPSLNEHLGEHMEELNTAEENVASAHQVGILSSWSIMVTALALSVAVGFYMTRSVLNPIGHLRTAAERISNGDLDFSIEVTSNDETAMLANAFNQMIVRLRNMLRSEQEQRQYLQSTIARYVEHMDQVTQGNLAARVSVGQAGREADDPLVILGHNLNETTASLEQMTSQTRQILAKEQEQREYLQATVQKYVDYMAEVGRGNLAARVSVDGNGRKDDPLIILGNNLNDTVASLQSMTRQIRDAANNLSAAAAEILAATTQQASGASEQSSAISQASTTIDEVRAIAEQTTQRATGVADVAQRTAQVSASGQQAVAETIEGMGQVKEKVESISRGILDLSEQTQAIGAIIATVNEIAAQSNMLALNASVEAARAGEAGKGFTVVAQEVRSLAEQSKAATEQIREILSEIQRGVNAAVMATEEGTKMADAGVRLAGDAGLAIRRLAESVTESTQSAVQISAAAGQQLTGVEQIALAMQSIDQATVQNLASTRQAEKSAQDLADLAHSLTEMVGRYQL